MTDEDKEYLVSVVESQIARWCDFTGFGAAGAWSAIYDKLKFEDNDVS